MEDSNTEQNVVPELYFLIAKFLSGGPLKETAKTILRELESVEVLPRRLDWEGNEHAQTYSELAAQFSDVSWRRLSAVCQRALQLARHSPSLSHALTEHTPTHSHTLRLNARLSLLSETLVRPKPKYASYKEDHSLVRRLAARELGAAGGRARVFPPRLLAGLQLQRRTLGHLSAVYCLVFDCTGTYVITGADDLLVKVWSARDGRLVTTLRGAGAEITDACVCPAGALLACGSVERLVRVWCLLTGAPRAVLHAHQGTITSVHWAPPGRSDVRWLASTSTDGSVAFWTCSPDGQFLSQPVQYVERMRPGACHMICAAWSAGGGFLAAGSADHHVRVYSVEGAGSGGPRRVLETAAHLDAVDSIAWAHRGLRFVSGSKDGSAALWTLHATQWRHVLLRTDTNPAKKLKVTMVCWDLSDAYVITAVSDHSIRVWDALSCCAVATLTGHRDEAYVLEAHPLLPAVLLSAGHDGQLFVWHAGTGEILARFHNKIEGQGEGAIFDAKWAAGGDRLAASDSHGHLLLLGLGAGDRLLYTLPEELFFHTDYRPLVRDALGGALDEQTETPPHLMPPPFLVDVEGAPHGPEFQRLVPGRQHLSLAQLVPAAGVGGAVGGAGGGAGPWRGEGVRHTAGAWQRAPLPAAPPAPLLPPLPPAQRDRIEETSRSLYAWEQAWYRREMRRRPLMISVGGSEAPRARPRARARPRPRPRPLPDAPAPPDDSPSDDTSDESVRLSVRSPNSRSSRSSRSSVDYSEDSSSHTSKTDNSSSSQYSDWEAGAALAPPVRARRRPVAAKRYSPSGMTSRRAERAATARSPAPPRSPAPAAGPAPGPAPARDLPEQYRPGEWLTAVSPRKAPYHPQMGDHCLYFRLGHQRYFEAVSEKDIYKVNPRDKPWERTHINECESVKVVGIKYVIKPPRVASLRLAAAGGRSFTVRYHDMPDVIDFLVLRQQYDTAVARGWKKGDRFRCMIDDSWWTGEVLENSAGDAGDSDGGGGAGGATSVDGVTAAHFLALRVRWDNGEVERLSPWDLEPIDSERLPAEPGGAVPVLARELEAALYRAEPHEWPRGPRAAACRAIAAHIQQVMSLSVAEPFVAPVDLQLYPSYAMVIPYPIDLSTIKARFENLFYRRAAAAQFDVRYLASNAERFNEPHSPIVRQARLVTDLLLHIISNWRDVDVLGKYHELAAAYHSSDEEPLSAAGRGPRWRDHCAALLRELASSADAEPFREPVHPEQAPDYHLVVSSPMDLGTARARLARGHYARPADLAADVRRVFSNSRLYNTNKRSRIYSMTVRLSALFEALWARLPRARRPRPPRRRSSSGSEPLAAVSRRARASRRNKGKGVGKKSKSKRSSPEPGPSTSAAADTETFENDVNGLPSGSEGEMIREAAVASESESEREDNIEVVEEELPVDEVELEYARSSGSSSRGAQSTLEPRVRKRRRLSSSSTTHTQKRTRERVRASWSSSSMSSGSGSAASGASAAARRYESDRSYRPRARSSSDDDAPLHLYRQRQEEEQPAAGPSRAGVSGLSRVSGVSGVSRVSRVSGVSRVSRVSGVSLRARSPRRYNEDSEDDSVAAISKRNRRHHHHHHRQHHAQVVSRTVPAPPTHTDHDYFNGHNGHAATHNGRADSASAGEAEPLSVSSRGRVRRLTAKARGLLRD